MLRVSLRNLVAHKLRLALTVLAVTLGVSFVGGTFVLSDTMTRAFDELYDRLTAGTDVAVRAELAYSDITTQGQSRPFDESVVDLVAGVPGVAVVEGSVSGFALVLDEAGDPIQPGGAPTFATSIGSDDELAGDFGLRSGRRPVGSDEIVLDVATADKGDHALGDRVTVVLQDGTATFTLVGTVGFGDVDSMAGATLAGFDLATAQELLGRVGQVDGISVRGDGSVSPATLRDRIAAVLPAGTEALTGQQMASEGSDAVREGLGVFTTVLLVFAGVSLLVGSFVIWNTFNVLVAQRRREIALLRAVGATRRQILGGIVIEAVTIGLVASGLGLIAGFALAAGIRRLLGVVGIEMPTTTPTLELRTVLAAVLVGVGVTVVAAVLPALAATRVDPIEALRDGDPTTEQIGPRRRALGWGLLGSGATGLVICSLVGDQAWGTGAATVVTFVGLVMTGPALAVAMARIVDRGRRGSPHRMAARTIARAPRRAAATALALTIGLSVVAAVAVTADSLKTSVTDAVSAGNRSDLVVTAVGASPGVSPAIAAQLRDRDDVATAVELRYSGAQIDGDVVGVAGVDASGLDQTLDLGVSSGSLGGFGPGTMLLSAQQAENRQVGVGDSLTMTFPETGSATFRVVAVFDEDTLIGSPYVVTLDDFATHVTSRLDGAVLVRLTSDASLSESQELIAAELAAYPNAQVSNAEEFTEDARASVDQLLGLVTALLLLSVVVAVLGIMNTLVLSVVERTRELGLLRAVGATRRQIGGLVRQESLLMSVLGALTGLSLGTGAGIALSRSLVDVGITAVSVPVTLLTVYLVVAVAVGVLAAIGPARRASRVDLLTAVTVE